MIWSKRLRSQTQLLFATRNAPIAHGARGPGIAALQDLFADLGFLIPKSRPNGRADGIFGAETEGIVKQFQHQHGLVPDGMVGPKTLGALDALILSNPFLEVLDLAAEKAQMLEEALLPIAYRKSAYW